MLAQGPHPTKPKGVPKNATNVGALSSGSQSAPPEQVGGKDSTAESHSKVDRSKAPPHALGPPHSSGLDSTTVSQKETQSKEPEKILANVGTGSSELPPAPREQVGVEDSAAESHSEVDKSKASQPLQPSGGLDTTAKPQKELHRTEPTKTLGNVGAPFGDSQPAPPEQVGVENPAAKSHSEADTSQASQHALDRANPPQPSTGTDTTTNSQKELHTTGHKGTEMNTADVGTPPLAKNPDSLKNQSTNGNMDVSAQGSRLSTPTTYFSASHRSEDVKDGTVSVQLPSHTAHSDHSNAEVIDQNEKSSNPSQPCEGASTPSIKLQENNEVNQLPQKEEPRSTKSKQKARDIAQAEDGQATTPSMEEDVNQQMTKYEGDIRGLKAKVLSMETFASQEARGYTEKIERLETKISILEMLVDQQQEKEKDNEEEVESFKARISAMEAWIFRMEHGVNMEHKKEIERLEGKQEKGIQRLEAIVEHLQTKVEHVANMEHKHEIEYLKGEHKKEIQRLEAIIERLQTKISSMEHAEHKQEIGRLEGKHEKEIQRLEAVVASMSEQVSKLEKEIGRLQPKVSEEDVKQPKKRQASDPPKSPDKKPIDSSQALQAQATKHSSTAANQKTSSLDQSLPRTSTSIKQINTPPSQTVVPKADSLSVTDVANLVKALNAEIGQTVNLFMDSLSDLGLPSSDNRFEIASDELRNYLGPGLCNKLEGKSDFDPLITQLALQMGLVSACSSVVNDSPFLHNGSILQTLYSRMAEKEGQAAADEWRAKGSNYLDLPHCEDANRKYLTEVLLKLATAVVGGTLESNKSLLPQYNQQLEVIAKSAAKLHKIITEDVRSSELITFTISCDTEFAASQMEDTENNHGSTPYGKVICTQEMGLLCRKRAEPKKPRGSLKDWGVTTKAKVVLAATLEG